MADYPRFQYSMKAVRRAGEVIGGKLPWAGENEDKIREAFQIANNWRDAHAYPMRSVRYSVLWYMRDCGLEGVTAARLKRMQAIRRKLGRINERLNQLQDLGGVRAILPSIAAVRALVATLRERSRHEIRDQDDYVSSPKDDGYRSHHLMFNYRGIGLAAAHDNRRIELQVRTRLQHSWATAVEAVGLFRGEDLKGNQGSSDWLRLFKLMSAEFAAAEECPEPPNVPPHADRVREIRSLDKTLKAAKTLENLSQAVRATELWIAPKTRSTYFLIVYDNATNQVHVEPHFIPKHAASAYDNAEAIDNKSGQDTTNVVLVEADKIENLKTAYPNYFGDVDVFKRNLLDIVSGKGAKEYTMPPRHIAPPPENREKPDPGWFMRSRFRKPRGA